jgi:hypothetical protein
MIRTLPHREAVLAYVKKLIDNTVCSRRFHITYDDKDKTQAEVKLACPFCGITIFEAQDHPPANLARQENLVKTAELSDNMVYQCNFKDVLSERTQKPHTQRSDSH